MATVKVGNIPFTLYKDKAAALSTISLCKSITGTRHCPSNLYLGQYADWVWYGLNALEALVPLLPKTITKLGLSLGIVSGAPAMLLLGTADPAKMQGILNKQSLWTRDSVYGVTPIDNGYVIHTKPQKLREGDLERNYSVYVPEKPSLHDDKLDLLLGKGYAAFRSRDPVSTIGNVLHLKSKEIKSKWLAKLSKFLLTRTASINHIRFIATAAQVQVIFHKKILNAVGAVPEELVEAMSSISFSDFDYINHKYESDDLVFLFDKKMPTQYNSSSIVALATDSNAAQRLSETKPKKTLVTDDVAYNPNTRIAENFAEFVKLLQVAKPNTLGIGDVTIPNRYYTDDPSIFRYAKKFALIMINREYEGSYNVTNFRGQSETRYSYIYHFGASKFLRDLGLRFVGEGMSYQDAYFKAFDMMNKAAQEANLDFDKGQELFEKALQGPAQEF